MRAVTRLAPFALLALPLWACGDAGDDEATDAGARRARDRGADSNEAVTGGPDQGTAGRSGAGGSVSGAGGGGTTGSAAGASGVNVQAGPNGGAAGTATAGAGGTASAGTGGATAGAAGSTGGTAGSAGAPAPILPQSWSCAPDEYDDGMACNCNCGAVDPDCGVDQCTKAPVCSSGAVEECVGQDQDGEAAVGERTCVDGMFGVCKVPPQTAGTGGTTGAGGDSSGKGGSTAAGGSSAGKGGSTAAGGSSSGKGGSTAAGGSSSGKGGSTAAGGSSSGKGGAGGSSTPPPACTPGSYVACTLPGGRAGARVCQVTGVYTECFDPNPPPPPPGSSCTPGSGTVTCQALNAKGVLTTGYQECHPVSKTWSKCHVTPLVLVFDDAPVVFTPAPAAASFAIAGSTTFDWPSSATPWLVLDRDGNGRIDDGHELFGPDAKARTAFAMPNGFDALAELDDDGDGVIDARDAAFERLAMWSDANGDRHPAPSEVSGIRASGLLAIDLRHHDEPRCDARDNCERQRARFTYRTGSGRVRQGWVVDVTLAIR